MKKIYLVTIILVTFYSASAQESTVQILEKTVQKIGALKSLSYETTFTSKNPFNNGDVTVGKKQTTLILDSDGLINAMIEFTTMNEAQTVLREIFQNDTLHTLDQVDSTYSFTPKSKSKISSGITAIREIIKEHLFKNPSKITRKADTLIDNRLCYSFLIKSYDVINDAAHDYSYKYLVIDQATYMPMYSKDIGEGMASKDGMSLGRLKIFSENHFSAIRINEHIDSGVFTFNTSGFYPPITHMLADGTQAPDLELRDLSNGEIAASNFKNKILLVGFGSTTCPANPLANPMLNRLSKMYASKGVSIVSIYSGETADQVKNYISTNKLEFPVYLGTRKLNKAFQTMGVPNFYVINKDGLVVKAVDGYRDDLETSLGKTLDDLTK